MYRLISFQVSEPMTQIMFQATQVSCSEFTRTQGSKQCSMPGSKHQLEAACSASPSREAVS
uniref:Uncharacterized protein n=1 Tax=Ulva partita TaxID=1605170 RepID=A0A1C9ZPH3_9CHLO|nr:hypothetical protein [Ulva partita]